MTASPEPTPGLRERLRPWLVHKMGCASTEGYGEIDGVRLTPQKPCNCGLDAALAASPAPEPTGLDAAWAEAEAAAPDWRINLTRGFATRLFIASAHDGSEGAAALRHGIAVAEGPTPAAALRALAARLSRAALHREAGTQPIEVSPLVEKDRP